MKGRGRQNGSMAVEMALLFPLLFLLWILVLRTLFVFVGRACTMAIGSRCLLICEEVEEGQWKEAVYRAAQGYAEHSPVPIHLTDILLEKKEHLFYTELSLRLEFACSIWGETQIEVSTRTYGLKNASLRNRIDLVWETGEELPGIGSALAAYQNQLNELRERMAN